MVRLENQEEMAQTVGGKKGCFVMDNYKRMQAKAQNKVQFAWDMKVSKNYRSDFFYCSGTLVKLLNIFVSALEKRRY